MYHMNIPFGEIALLQITDIATVPFNTNRPTDPIFVLNTTASMTDPLSNFPMFRMELNIYPVYNDLHQDLLISHGTLADYPFDRYHAVSVVLLV